MLGRDSFFLARLVNGGVVGQAQVDVSRVSEMFRPVAERLLAVAPEQRDAVVEVKEKNTGSLSFGASAHVWVLDGGRVYVIEFDGSDVHATLALIATTCSLTVSQTGMRRRSA